MISLYLFVRVVQFAAQLLDSFWPSVFSPFPGVLMAVVTISLVTSVVILVLGYADLHFTRGDCAVVCEIASTFSFGLSSLGFLVTYGSPILRDSQIQKIHNDVIVNCRYGSELCASFQKLISARGTQDIKSLIAQYIDARSGKIRSALGCPLLLWLILHAGCLFLLWQGNEVPVLHRSTESGINHEYVGPAQTLDGSEEEEEFIYRS
jgi:hypothetical protein